ncbi:MAG TPA: SRPBCC domain-containing protein [Dehalococcoidia bacterium]|nr:SRPBCC domain-containing protein [Dehalococcoidia bacterium]
MLTSSDDFLEMEVYIAASPETVFSFLTDAAKMTRWMGLEAEIEARPGGKFWLNVTGRDIASGQVLEESPPNQIVLTWGWEGEGNPLPPGSSRVELTLRPEGTGTRLRLRHSGLSGQLREEHSQGWSHYLERLAIVASGGQAGPDPWATPAPEQ